MHPSRYILLLRQVAPEATAYINALVAAGGSPSSTVQAAINTFVVAGQTAGWWAKMLAVYPLIGGTSATHAINAKAPGTNNITWSGTLTHNSNGITSDGSTGYGDTGILARSMGANDYGLYAGAQRYDTSLGYYVRGTQAFAAGGRRSNNGPDDRGYILRTSSANVIEAQLGSNEGLTTASWAGAGLICTSGWHGGTQIKIYRNGSPVTLVANSATKVDVGSDVAPKIYLCAIHKFFQGPSFYEVQNNNCAFFYVANNILADSEIASLYSAVQALQTTLGRQV